MGGAFYLALLPWLTFAAADRSAGLKPEDDALIATGVALTICANQLRLRERHVLSIFAVGLFAALSIFTVTVASSARLDHDYRAMIFAALSLYLFGTLVRKPVTLTYASNALLPRRSVTPAFRSFHRKLTLRWASAIGGIALSLTIGAILHGQVAATVCNWFLPMALIVAVINVPSARPPSARDEMSYALDVLDTFRRPSASSSGYAGVPSTSRSVLHLVEELPEESGH
jgi:hypothetical protein